MSSVSVRVLERSVCVKRETDRESVCVRVESSHGLILISAKLLIKCIFPSLLNLSLSLLFSPLLLPSPQLKVARALLKEGADPEAKDKNEWTPLLHAAYSGI